MGAPGFSETTAFVAVLEQKSFTRAAKQLGLSPSRVSELIRGLEESLGVRLVERTTRSVAATAAGERFWRASALCSTNMRQHSIP